MSQINQGQIILVTGAARSGKSEWAEILATEMNKPIIYVATALVDVTDQEWQARITKHQLRRPKSWKTLLVPQKLATTIDNSPPSTCLLIDSVGTWVANFLDQNEQAWKQTEHKLLNSLKQTKSDLILVAEETGWGVVPAYKIGRLFRDRLGTLVRKIGAISTQVYLVTGGHVLNLSVLGKPLPLPSQ